MAPPTDVLEKLENVIVHCEVECSRLRLLQRGHQLARWEPSLESRIRQAAIGQILALESSIKVLREEWTRRSCEEAAAAAPAAAPPASLAPCPAPRWSPEEDRNELDHLARRLRRRAIHRGLNDPAWDLAYDIEAYLRQPSHLSVHSVESLKRRARPLFGDTLA